MDWIGLGRLAVGHSKSEWNVITGAPGAAFLVAVLFFLAIWYFVKCHFSHTLSAKDSALSSKDASIESLNERFFATTGFETFSKKKTRWSNS